LELSIGMKHKMVSDAICNKENVRQSKNKIWKDVKKKKMHAN